MPSLWGVHPALPLLLGGLSLFLLRGRAAQVALVLAPILGLWNLAGLDSAAAADAGVVELAGMRIDLLRVDRLSLLFGLLFHIAALLAAIYSLHLRDRVQLATGLLYAGSAVGAVFAGDLLVLFLFWELLAVSSVFQVWCRRTEESRRAGMRYLLTHLTSGMLLLAGAGLRFVETGGLEFEGMTLDSTAAWLVLLAFGIKAAFPLLHTWLVDAYPAATVTGPVFLSAFTTKTAIYALARGFPGVELLVWVGAAMTMFPIFYAVIENDLRRVLSYSLINQLGYMVVGIGLGTELALNGTVAHVFAHVLYKGLLFMSMGAVLLRTGRINGSDLGGLYKSMPWTAGFCMVGAASISAFPLFSGFVSKGMVMAAAAEEGRVAVWLMLLFASAGVFHHAGIKIPYFAFFAHDSGLRPREAPPHMLVAMALASALCVGIGCFPGLLYGLLPYPVEYVPYTVAHVVQQLQLLFFSALAFTVLMLTRVYPPELRSVNLDVDWLVRRALPRLAAPAVGALNVWTRAVRHATSVSVQRTLRTVGRLHGPSGRFGEPWPSGVTAFWAALLLAVFVLSMAWSR
ncbi:MAG TPA: Na(+)/H(+) antiporter subunit D [Thermoanaerobaculia bacterium]|nr:Na(+)/H(+) antiporter subunit D [Thermoanaerobaculia bacterium]